MMSNNMAGVGPVQAYTTNPYLPNKNASLYVGDLHPSVTETVLFKQFATVGQVLSVRIPRDPITRISLGYGYVNYQDSKDAQKALDLYQSHVFNGRACRLMWVQRDPSLRKSNVGNVIIKNLDKSIDSKFLNAQFSKFGSILSCKVVYDDENKSKGYGFVHYNTEQEALDAITHMNGKELVEKQISVEAFTKNRTPANLWTNCYIKQFPATWTEENLKEKFAPFGEITSMKMEKSRGKPFAFINYKTHEMAAKATEAMNKVEQSYIDENGEEKPLELFVSDFQSKRVREKENREKALMKKRERIQKYAGCNVFLKNLDDNCKEDWLRDYFSQFGTITSCKIATTDNHTSLGHGYICFSAQEEATEAIKQTNRKQIAPWAKPFYVCLHQPADERRQALQRENFNMPRNPINGIMQMQQTYNNPYAMQPSPYHLGIPGGLNQFGRPMGPYGGMLPNQRGPSAILRNYPYPTPGVPFQQHIYDTRPMMPHYVPRGPKKNPRKVPGGNRGQTIPMGGQPPMMNDMNSMHNTVPNQPVDPYNQGQAMPMQNQQQQQSQQQQARGVQGNMGINTEKLAELPEDQRKLTLGERLYPLVAGLNAENAPKITGMILELDNTEIINLLEDTSLLKDKVDEAVRVLNEYVEK